MPDSPDIIEGFLVDALRSRWDDGALAEAMGRVGDPDFDWDAVLERATELQVAPVAARGHWGGGFGARCQSGGTSMRSTSTRRVRR